MSAIRIGKRYTFDAAHQLKNHNGKCANVHGHTYTVEVWVKGEQLTNTESWRPFVPYPGNKSDETMVIDYFDLDVIVKPIIEMLDHSFMSAKRSEPIFDIVDETSITLPEMTDKAVDGALGNVVVLPIRRTTAEALAVYLWDQIADTLYVRKNVQLLGVVVSETPRTFAEFIAEVPSVGEQK